MRPFLVALAGLIGLLLALAAGGLLSSRNETGGKLVPAPTPSATPTGRDTGGH